MLTATVLSLLLMGASPGARDSVSVPAPAPAPAPQVSQAGLATPRSAVQAFLVAARAARYTEAARYLDLSQIPEQERTARGPLLARELKVVLDQKLWIDLESLSERSEGNLDDGLEPDRDLVGVIQASRGAFEIILRRTHGPGPEHAWRFSPGTLERAEVVYAEIGYGALLSWIPDWATGMRVGNIEAWQWIALFLLATLAVLMSRVLTSAIYAVIRRLGRRTEPEFRERLLESIHPPARLISALGVVTLGALCLRLSVPARRTLNHIAVILLVALAAWTLMRLADLAMSRTLARFEAQGRRSAVSTLTLMRRIIKGIILAVAGLALLQNLGFNVSGLLAGFGIAGAAVALAAQKTIENLFAGLVLTADESVRMGDLCRFDDKQGTVEDIGLRSTRVRTLDRTVLSVPNASLFSMPIENFTRRDRIRLFTLLKLRHETSQAQLASVLKGLRDLFAQDPRVSPDGMRVRLVALGPYSLDVEVVAYVLTNDVPTFLAIQEELFFHIMKIVSDNGTGFALPSQTLYMTRDPLATAGMPAKDPTA